MRKVVLSFALFAALAGGGVFAQKKPSLTGTQIVRKMAATYAAAKSYRDEGVVQVVKPKASETVIEPVNFFKTYYARPKRIRFEWESYAWNGERLGNILWSDGKNTYSYQAWGELERVENISTAVGYAAAVSTGAAEMVTVLLLNDVSGFRITELKKISLLRVEEFEGEACYVVRGYGPLETPIELWISKKDFLLRKEREKDEDGNVYEDIRRNVTLNEPIREETFVFTPPAKTDYMLTAKR